MPGGAYQRPCRRVASSGDPRKGRFGVPVSAALRPCSDGSIPTRAAADAITQPGPQSVDRAQQSHRSEWFASRRSIQRSIATCKSSITAIRLALTCCDGLFFLSRRQTRSSSACLQRRNLSISDKARPFSTPAACSHRSASARVRSTSSLSRKSNAPCAALFIEVSIVHPPPLPFLRCALNPTSSCSAD
jgi:hypothetical protein